MKLKRFNIYYARTGLIVFTIILCLFLVHIISEIKSSVSMIRKIEANRISTKGVVIAVDTGPNRHDYWTLTVSYKDSHGIEHWLYAPIWFHWFGYPGKDELVEVVYDKTNPRHAYLDGFLDRWGPSIRYLLFAAGLLGLILFSGYNGIFGSADRLKSLTGYWDDLGNP